jgi:hypothetical protein
MSICIYLNLISFLSLSISVPKISVLGSVVVGWRPTFHHMLTGAQLLVVLLSQLDNATLAIKLFSDLLVSLDELIDLSRQLVILVAHNPDVVIHRVDLNLQVSVRFNQRRI